MYVNAGSLRLQVYKSMPRLHLLKAIGRSGRVGTHIHIQYVVWGGGIDRKRAHTEGRCVRGEGVREDGEHETHGDC